MVVKIRTPPPAGECAPSPFGYGGWGTLAWGREGGGGGPNSDEGTYTGELQPCYTIGQYPSKLGMLNGKTYN